MALVMSLACCCMTLICYAADGHAVVVPRDAESQLYGLVIARIISQSQNMSTRTEVDHGRIRSQQARFGKIQGTNVFVRHIIVKWCEISNCRLMDCRG